MLSMISQILSFFLFFGVSHKIESLGWSNQGDAFVNITIGLPIFVCILYLIGLAVASASNKKIKKMKSTTVIYLIISVIIIYFASQIAANFFNIEFTTAYQIMFFGRCLCTFNEKSE